MISFLRNKFLKLKILLSILRKNTVVVALSGDLGSQIFQYAVGLTIAAKFPPHGEISYDLADYEHFKFFQPSLPEIGIHPKIAERKSIHYMQKLAKMKSFFKMMFPSWPRKIIENSPDEILAIPSRGNLLIHGYWRNPEYFLTRKDELRNAIHLPKLDASLFTKIKSIQDRGAWVFVAPDQYWVQKEDFLNWLERAKKKVGTADFEIVHLSDRTKRFIGEGLDLSLYSQSQQLGFMVQISKKILTPSLIAWWAAWLYSETGEVLFPKDWFGPLQLRKNFPSLPSWSEY